MNNKKKIRFVFESLLLIQTKLILNSYRHIDLIDKTCCRKKSIDVKTRNFACKTTKGNMLKQISKRQVTLQPVTHNILKTLYATFYDEFD